MKEAFMFRNSKALSSVGMASVKSPAQAAAMAEPPTMGWSSWNTYRVNISEEMIKLQADALVALGLDKVGYNHVNIDDGYFGGRDETTGKLKIHPNRFPNGLKPLVDYIHSKGLKAGIYSDAGGNTCGSFYDHDEFGVNAGFYNHDQQDADFLFKELEFDFVKIDFCGGCSWSNADKITLVPCERYTAIRQAINATGRTDVRMNICRWAFPGTWAHNMGCSWRIAKDIAPTWTSIRDILNKNLLLSAYAWGGHYNDMDMLEVGRGMTPEEDNTHFGLWCMMSSPLLIGCDLTKLKPETLDLLKNEELIALNQDPLGLQAYVTKHFGHTGYVLVKDVETLFGTTRAVAFYNWGNEPESMEIDFTELELEGEVKVRDLFARKDLGTMKGKLTAEVPAHGTRIYRLVAERRAEPTFYSAEIAWLSSFQDLAKPEEAGTAYFAPHPVERSVMVAHNLGGRADNYLLWRNVYSKAGGQYELEFTSSGGNWLTFHVEVNGMPAGTVDPETKKNSVPVFLKNGINVVRLHNDTAPMRDIVGMRLKPSEQQ